MNEEKIVTQDELKKSGLKIADSRKVNLKYDCLKVIDEIIKRMYSPAIQLLMQKRGYSVEPDDITEAKGKTKKKMISYYLDGKTTKELTGVMSELQTKLKEELDI